MQLLRILVIAFLSVFACSVMASPVETYTFKDEVSQKRYNSLVKELRCPKCQNQNLADSNSQIAVDLRQEVYEMVEQGKADSEIVNFMVDRYGEFVLYRPKVSSLTYVLWFGPVVFLIGGLIIVVAMLRRKPKAQEQASLSSEQQDKLNQILKDK
ncbi:cytochrome c-type biogenesis protein [Thalassotalea sp. PLHSN55]|uniref:cytochrome c-type biogenesis protein n=1 Tax=Thalassotalea sp. PLHSN55 TaxID=3435888 RepID=UPI003F827C70